eukprot:3682801-Rhodomonas_salina.1
MALIAAALLSGSAGSNRMLPGPPCPPAAIFSSASSVATAPRSPPSEPRLALRTPRGTATTTASHSIRLASFPASVDPRLRLGLARRRRCASRPPPALPPRRAATPRSASARVGPRSEASHSTADSQQRRASASMLQPPPRQQGYLEGREERGKAAREHPVGAGVGGGVVQVPPCRAHARQRGPEREL